MISVKTKHRSITDLPIDVLIEIFKYIYSFSQILEEHAEWPYQDNSSDPHLKLVSTRWDERVDLCGSTLFPDALASVCRLWRDALQLVSVFWTRVVVFVDDDPTPMSMLGSRLELSASHPLHITIMRRPTSHRDADPLERRRVSDTMCLLYPHISRWHRFHINVLHASSLPVPHVELQGDALCLFEMRFESQIDEIQYDVADWMPRFNAPALTELRMDGLTFRRAFLFSPASISHVQELSITRYARGHRLLFTFRNLIDCLCALPNLTWLDLVDLDILPEVGTGPILGLSRCRPRYCKFELLSSAITRLLSLCLQNAIYDLSLTQCTIPHRIDLSSVGDLRLQNIDHDQDLEPLLLNWDSVHLCVHSCPGFGASLLSAMAYEIDGHDNWLCPRLTILELLDCTNFTSADMRAMVQARHKAHAESGFADDFDDEFTVTSLTHLTVVGNMELWLADREWLDQNVDYVSWNGWCGGYARQTVYHRS